jgi:hypothetical protein
MNEDEYLQEKAEEVRNLESTNLLQIGRILIEVKERLANHKNGRYGEWVKNDLGISREKARILEHRALLYLRTKNEKLNDIKEVSNLAVSYIARNELDDKEIERMIEDKEIASERIKEEKTKRANKSKFGNLKFEIEEIKKILMGLEAKGLVDRVRSLTAIEMKLKRFEREVRELKEKTRRRQEEKVNRKMF